MNLFGNLFRRQRSANKNTHSQHSEPKSPSVPAPTSPYIYVEGLESCAHTLYLDQNLLSNLASPFHPPCDIENYTRHTVNNDAKAMTGRVPSLRALCLSSLAVLLGDAIGAEARMQLGAVPHAQLRLQLPLPAATVMVDTSAAVVALSGVGDRCSSDVSAEGRARGGVCSIGASDATCCPHTLADSGRGTSSDPGKRNAQAACVEVCACAASDTPPIARGDPTAPASSHPSTTAVPSHVATAPTTPLLSLYLPRSFATLPAALDAWAPCDCHRMHARPLTLQHAPASAQTPSSASTSTVTMDAQEDDAYSADFADSSNAGVGGAVTAAMSPDGGALGRFLRGGVAPGASGNDALLADSSGVRSHNYTHGDSASTSHVPPSAYSASATPTVTSPRPLLPLTAPRVPWCSLAARSLWTPAHGDVARAGAKTPKAGAGTAGVGVVAAVGGGSEAHGRSDAGVRDSSASGGLPAGARGFHSSAQATNDRLVVPSTAAGATASSSGWTLPRDTSATTGVPGASRAARSGGLYLPSHAANDGHTAPRVRESAGVDEGVCTHSLSRTAHVRAKVTGSVVRALGALPPRYCKGSLARQTLIRTATLAGTEPSNAPAATHGDLHSGMCPSDDARMHVSHHVHGPSELLEHRQRHSTASAVLSSAPANTHSPTLVAPPLSSLPAPSASTVSSSVMRAPNTPVLMLPATLPAREAADASRHMHPPTIPHAQAHTFQTHSAPPPRPAQPPRDTATHTATHAPARPTPQPSRASAALPRSQQVSTPPTPLPPPASAPAVKPPHGQRPGPGQGAWPSLARLEAEEAGVRVLAGLRWVRRDVVGAGVLPDSQLHPAAPSAVHTHATSVVRSLSPGALRAAGCWCGGVTGALAGLSLLARALTGGGYACACAAVEASACREGWATTEGGDDWDEGNGYTASGDSNDADSARPAVHSAAGGCDSDGMCADVVVSTACAPATSPHTPTQSPRSSRTRTRALASSRASARSLVYQRVCRAGPAAACLCDDLVTLQAPACLALHRTVAAVADSRAVQEHKQEVVVNGESVVCAEDKAAERLKPFAPAPSSPDPWALPLAPPPDTAPIAASPCLLLRIYLTAALARLMLRARPALAHALAAVMVTHSLLTPLSLPIFAQLPLPSLLVQRTPAQSQQHAARHTATRLGLPPALWTLALPRPLLTADGALWRWLLGVPAAPCIEAEHVRPHRQPEGHARGWRVAPDQRGRVRALGAAVTEVKEVHEIITHQATSTSSTSSSSSSGAPHLYHIRRTARPAHWRSPRAMASTYIALAAAAASRGAPTQRPRVDWQLARRALARRRAADARLREKILRLTSEVDVAARPVDEQKAADSYAAHALTGMHTKPVTHLLFPGTQAHHAHRNSDSAIASSLSATPRSPRRAHAQASVESAALHSHGDDVAHCAHVAVDVAIEVVPHTRVDHNAADACVDVYACAPAVVSVSVRLRAGALSSCGGDRAHEGSKCAVEQPCSSGGADLGGARVEEPADVTQMHAAATGGLGHTPAIPGQAVATSADHDTTCGASRTKSCSHEEKHAEGTRHDAAHTSTHTPAVAIADIELTVPCSNDILGGTALASSYSAETACSAEKVTSVALVASHTDVGRPTRNASLLHTPRITPLRSAAASTPPSPPSRIRPPDALSSLATNLHHLPLPRLPAPPAPSLAAITTLDLSGAAALTQHSLSLLAQLSALRSLSLARVPALTDGLLALILLGTPALVALDISGCAGLSGRVVTVLARSGCAWESLQMDGIAVGDRAMAVLERWGEGEEGWESAGEEDEDETYEEDGVAEGKGVGAVWHGGAQHSGAPPHSVSGAGNYWPRGPSAWLSDAGDDNTTLCSDSVLLGCDNTRHNTHAGFSGFSFPSSTEHYHTPLNSPEQHRQCRSHSASRPPHARPFPFARLSRLSLARLHTLTERGLRWLRRCPLLAELDISHTAVADLSFLVTNTPPANAWGNAHRRVGTRGVWSGTGSPAGEDAWEPGNVWGDRLAPSTTSHTASVWPLSTVPVDPSLPLYPAFPLLSSLAAANLPLAPLTLPLLHVRGLFPLLTSLSIAHTHTGGWLPAALLGVGGRLRSLDVSYCELTDGGWREAITALGDVEEGECAERLGVASGGCADGGVIDGVVAACGADASRLHTVAATCSATRTTAATPTTPHCPARLCPATSARVCDALTPAAHSAYTAVEWSWPWAMDTVGCPAHSSVTSPLMYVDAARTRAQTDANAPAAVSDAFTSDAVSTAASAYDTHATRVHPSTPAEASPDSAADTLGTGAHESRGGGGQASVSNANVRGGTASPASSATATTIPITGHYAAAPRAPPLCWCAVCLAALNASAHAAAFAHTQAQAHTHSTLCGAAVCGHRRASAHGSCCGCGEAGSDAKGGVVCAGKRTHTTSTRTASAPSSSPLTDASLHTNVQRRDDDADSRVRSTVPRGDSDADDINKLSALRERLSSTTLHPRHRMRRAGAISGVASGVGVWQDASPPTAKTDDISSSSSSSASSSASSTFSLTSPDDTGDEFFTPATSPVTSPATSPALHTPVDATTMAGSKVATGAFTAVASASVSALAAPSRSSWHASNQTHHATDHATQPTAPPDSPQSTYTHALAAAPALPLSFPRALAQLPQPAQHSLAVAMACPVAQCTCAHRTRELPHLHLQRLCARGLYWPVHARRWLLSLGALVELDISDGVVRVEEAWAPLGMEAETGVGVTVAAERERTQGHAERLPGSSDNVDADEGTNNSSNDRNGVDDVPLPAASLSERWAAFHAPPSAPASTAPTAPTSAAAALFPSLPTAPFKPLALPALLRLPQLPPPPPFLSHTRTRLHAPDAPLSDNPMCNPHQHLQAPARGPRWRALWTGGLELARTGIYSNTGSAEVTPPDAHQASNISSSTSSRAQGGARNHTRIHTHAGAHVHTRDATTGAARLLTNPGNPYPNPYANLHVASDHSASTTTTTATSTAVAAAVPTAAFTLTPTRALAALARAYTFGPTDAPIAPLALAADALPHWPQLRRLRACGVCVGVRALRACVERVAEVEIDGSRLFDEWAGLREHNNDNDDDEADASHSDRDGEGLLDIDTAVGLHTSPATPAAPSSASPSVTPVTAVSGSVAGAGDGDEDVDRTVDGAADLTQPAAAHAETGEDTLPLDAFMSNDDDDDIYNEDDSFDDTTDNYDDDNIYVDEYNGESGVVSRTTRATTTTTTAGVRVTGTCHSPRGAPSRIDAHGSARARTQTHAPSLAARTRRVMQWVRLTNDCRTRTAVACMACRPVLSCASLRMGSVGAGDDLLLMLFRQRAVSESEGGAEGSTVAGSAGAAEADAPVVMITRANSVSTSTSTSTSATSPTPAAPRMRMSLRHSLWRALSAPVAHAATHTPPPSTPSSASASPVASATPSTAAHTHTPLPCSSSNASSVSTTATTHRSRASSTASCFSEASSPLPPASPHWSASLRRLDVGGNLLTAAAVEVLAELACGSGPSAQAADGSGSRNDGNSAGERVSDHQPSSSTSPLAALPVVAPSTPPLSLRSLGLSGCTRITDRALTPLALAPSLAHLSLAGTGATALSLSIFGVTRGARSVTMFGCASKGFRDMVEALPAHIALGYPGRLLARKLGQSLPSSMYSDKDASGGMDGKDARSVWCDGETVLWRSEGDEVVHQEVLFEGEERRGDDLFARAVASGEVGHVLEWIPDDDDVWKDTNMQTTSPVVSPTTAYAPDNTSPVHTHGSSASQSGHPGTSSGSLAIATFEQVGLMEVWNVANEGGGIRTTQFASGVSVAGDALLMHYGQ